MHLQYVFVVFDSLAVNCSADAGKARVCTACINKSLRTCQETFISIGMWLAVPVLIVAGVGGSLLPGAGGASGFSLRVVMWRAVLRFFGATSRRISARRRSTSTRAGCFPQRRMRLRGRHGACPFRVPTHPLRALPRHNCCSPLAPVPTTVHPAPEGVRARLMKRDRNDSHDRPACSLPRTHGVNGRSRRALGRDRIRLARSCWACQRQRMGGHDDR
jgi:hypothetical protein